MYKSMYKSIREQERSRYLATSPYHDSTQRWRRYEDLILAKYELDRHKFRRRRLVSALDEAWRNRDYHHQNLVSGK